MADEIRVVPDSQVPVVVDPALAAERQRAVAAHGTGGTGSTDPGAVRAEIEQTRARMSHTIDGIEDALVRKKEEIHDKMDVLAPVRERPLPSSGIAFGAGLLLGLATGGNDDHKGRGSRANRSRASSDSDESHWHRRSEQWENRAYRLRDIAREQEEELRNLEERWGEARTADMAGDSPAGAGGRRPDRDAGRDESQANKDSSGLLGSTMNELRDHLVGGITGFLTSAVHELTAPQGSRHSE